MSQPSPDARHVARAVDALTTQVRRIADTVSTPVAIISDAPTTTADDGPAALRDMAATLRYIDPQGFREAADCCEARAFAVEHGGATPAADEDAQRTARRASLRIILDRASRGVILRSDEAALLRQHVAAEQRDTDTARAALSQAHAAIERVRTLADEYATSDERWRPSARLTGQVFRSALDGTEQPTTKG